jgi:GTPase SAR1 family protein
MFDFDSEYNKILHFISNSNCLLNRSEYEKKLMSLKEWYQSKHFNIAVVGEFSAGKTHFINQLIGRELLLESAVPTTAVCTEISFCNEHEKNDSFSIFRSSDGKETNLSENEVITACGNDEYCLSHLLKCRLTNADFYTNLKLYDTPGIDDIVGKRAMIAYELMDRTDAAVIVISALRPFGLCEKSFLSNYVINKKITRCAICLSYMDKLDDQSKCRVLNHVINEVRKFVEHIDIFILNVDDSDLSEKVCLNGSQIFIGKKNVIRQLNEWSHGNYRNIIQEQQKLRFFEILSSCEQDVDNYITLLDSKISETEGHEKNILSDLNEKNSKWIDIKRDFISSSRDLSSDVSERLQNLMVGIRNFKTEKDSSEHQLALNAFIKKESKSITEFINSKICSDLATLKSRVRDEFGYDFIYKETEVRFDAEKFLNEELISKCEIESDLGTQLFQMLVGCIDYAKTFIPSEHQKLVSIADSVIVFLNKSISKRNIAEKNVRFNVSVASFVETFSSSVNSLISNIYDKAAEHLVGEKNKWFKSNYDELVGLELNELKQRRDKYLEFCTELKKLKSTYGD